MVKVKVLIEFGPEEKTAKKTVEFNKIGYLFLHPFGVEIPERFSNDFSMYLIID